MARVESKTVIVTPDQRDTVPSPVGGGPSQLGRWMSSEEFDKAVTQRFPGCMKGIDYFFTKYHALVRNMLDFAKVVHFPL